MTFETINWNIISETGMVDTNLLDFVRLNLICVPLERRLRIPLKIFFQSYCFFIAGRNEVAMGSRVFRVQLETLFERIGLDNPKIFIKKVNNVYIVFNVGLKKNPQQDLKNMYEAFYCL